MLSDSKQREMKVLNKMLDVMDPEMRLSENRGPFSKNVSREVFGEMPDQKEQDESLLKQQKMEKEEAD